MSAEPLRRLHPSAVTLWRLETLWRGATLAVPALVLEILADLPLPTGVITGLIAVVTVGLALALPPLRYRAWGFTLRSGDLYLERGVLFRTVSIIPHSRIQHVDTQHGPIERWLVLASVVVYTAGTRGAILEIPALAAGQAEELRDRLVALSGRGDAV